MRHTWTDWQALDVDACAAESAFDEARPADPEREGLRTHASTLRLAADALLSVLRVEAAEAEQLRTRPRSHI
jgi:hypothetical protein